MTVSDTSTFHCILYDYQLELFPLSCSVAEQVVRVITACLLLELVAAALTPLIFCSADCTLPTESSPEFPISLLLANLQKHRQDTSSSAGCYTACLFTNDLEPV